MKSLFNLDSPVMQALSRMADLIILNVFWIVLCLPIVTAGAATTAMYRVLLDYAKKEDRGVVKRFFQAFKDNFKPATIVYLILLVPTALVLMNLWLMASGQIKGSGMFLICAIPALMLVFVAAWVYPYIATFDNKILRTIQNAFVLGLGNLPRSITMGVLNLLPLIMYVFLTELFFRSAIIWIFIGFSGVAYMNALMIWPVFKKFIPEEE